MQFTMTLRQALAIQERDIKWYGHYHPQGEEGLRADVKAISANIDDLNLDAEYYVCDINELVPRGVAIERMLRLKFGGD